jgi:hypothetical protein
MLEPNNRALVAAVARCSPIEIRYIHQPKPGIAAARNAALDAAMGRRQRHSRWCRL